MYDPASVSRAMVEETLRYKRLDGVEAALTAIAQAWFADGRQHLYLTDRLRQLTIPVQLIWGRDDRIVPVAMLRRSRRKFRSISSTQPAICRIWKKPEKSVG